MSEELKYCMGCMESIPYDSLICPHCGYNEETLQPAPFLEPGNLISRKYLVGRVISTSPDTITYIGANIENGEVVDVIEFFPHNIVTRNEGETEPTVKLGYDSMFSECLQSFLNLWRGLDIFKDATCLPNVHDIIDFNGTVYAVCEHKDCITLRQYFGENDVLTWPRAFSAFKPVMYALKKLNYAGIVHGALSPETILVGSDGKLHITGFSIPQCNNGVAEFASAPAEGFAPIELFDTSGATAKTDVYSITALLYYCITLTPPPESTQRIIKDTTTLPASVASTLSKGVIDGLILGLSIYPENRFEGFDELINALRPAEAPLQPPVTQEPAQKPLTQKEEVDLEIQRELEEQKALKKEKREAKANASVGIKAFLSGFVICAVLFCVFYGTVIYKNYPIDFMDKLLKPITFLPLNGEQETTQSTTEVVVPTEPNYITVADFVNNHTIDSIRQNTFFTENYRFDIITKESTEHPKGAIISQSIEPGESVLSGTLITLVVSDGTTKIKLTDVAGVNYLIASETLQTAGFKVKIKLLENDGKHTVGEVFSMDQKAGELYEKSTVITLSVWNKIQATTAASTTSSSSNSTGTSTTSSASTAASTTAATTSGKLQIPDVTGMAYRDAYNALEQAGFKVKYKLLTNDGSHVVGEVYATSPKAGEYCDKDTVVTLGVWNKVETASAN